jgi:hypothetical protein
MRTGLLLTGLLTIDACRPVFHNTDEYAFMERVITAGIYEYEAQSGNTVGKFRLCEHIPAEMKYPYESYLRMLNDTTTDRHHRRIRDDNMLYAESWYRLPDFNRDGHVACDSLHQHTTQ